MAVLILTEGGQGTGFGHIVRCGALADALSQMGLSVHTVVRGKGIPPSLLESDVVQQDWLAEKGYLSIDDYDVIVVDSYSYDEEWATALSSQPCQVLWWDDEERIAYPRGTILNPTASAVGLYSDVAVPNLRFLIGPRYQPLRRAFHNPPHFRVRQNIRRVFLTFGGTSQEEIFQRTRRLIADRYPAAEIVTPTRPPFPRRSFEPLGDAEIRKALEMSDLAVTAGGQTLIECVRTGIPTVAIEIASNQHRHIIGWADLGAVVAAGKPTDLFFDESFSQSLLSLSSVVNRQSLSDAGGMALDGLGGERVALYIRDLIEGQGESR